MTRDDALFKEFLLDVGLLSRGQISTVESLSQNSGESLYQSLVQSGYISEDDARLALAKSLSIPFATPHPKEISPTTLFLLPEAFCRTHSLVAYREEADRVYVLLLEPEVLDHVVSLDLPFAVVAHLTNRQTIKRILLYYQQLLKDKHTGHIAELAKAIPQPTGAELGGVHSIQTHQLVDILLEHALSQSATDIHFDPKMQGLLVRYRIGDRLYDAHMLPTHTAPSVVSRLKQLANMNLESLHAQEGKFKVALEDSALKNQATFRVASMPIAQGSHPEKLVVHIAREQEGGNGFMLESLGMHGPGLDLVHRFLSKKQGLILVCGGRTSGATTLLYTLLDHLVDSTRSVVTVEDRIESFVKGAVQTQVGAEQMSGAMQLQAVIKMDPDVVMVSSLASQAEALLALRAANEGRIVLTSMAADTPLEGVLALAEATSERLVASVLTGVIGTKLVKRLCRNHDQTKLSREELQELEARGVDFAHVLEVLKEEGRIDQNAQWKDVSFGRAKPCSECMDGYRGYVGLHEVMSNSLLLQNVIRGGESLEEVKLVIDSENHLTFLEDALYKAALGLTSPDEVFGLEL